MSVVSEALVAEVGDVLNSVGEGEPVLAVVLNGAAEALAARPALLLDLIAASPEGAAIITELVERCVVAQPEATFSILLGAKKIIPAGHVQVQGAGGNAVRARVLETVWRLL